MSNLKNKIVKYLLSVAQAFILLYVLICYSTMCNRLLQVMPQRTEWKHLLFDAAWIFHYDGICLRNSSGGGGAGTF